MSVIENVHQIPRKDDPALCACPSAITCSDCKIDVENKARSSEFSGGVVIYKCPHHGPYRTYQDSLINFKNWCLLWVSIALVPFGLLMYEVGVDLNWLMIVGAIITVPSFPGVIMSVTWVKATAKGLVTGVVLGFIFGITTNLTVAYTKYRGEGDFFRATSELYAALGGSAVGGTVSLVMTILVSLWTHKIRTSKDEHKEWEKLRNIDNPLHPWSQEFAGEFPEVAGGACRPSQEQLESYGRKGKLCSIGGSIAFIVIFIFTLPGAMSSLRVLSVSEFKGWTMFVTAWLIVAACVMIIVTPVEEIYHIVKALRRKFAVKVTTPRVSRNRHESAEERLQTKEMTEL